MVKTTTEINNKLIKISQEGFPYEVCGFLLGKLEYGENKSDGTDTKFDIKEVLVCENINKESPEVRFMMKEGEWQRAEEVADEKGLRVIGVYHSHPNHKAYASTTDNLYAQPDTIYLIYSILEAKFHEVKGYMLNTKINKLQETEIQIS